MFLFLGIGSVQAQTKGKIIGSISDATTGEKLIGVTVAIPEMKTGGKSGLSGNYTIQVVPGTYKLRVSYLGYKTKEIEGVEVKANESKKVDVTLETAAIKGEEVVVTSKIATETQTAQLLERKKSATMNDVLGAEQIRRTPDATSGDAIKRIPGVSVMDNKFVSIRGTNERYNNTLINGSAITSTEPDKKAFSFDILPSNLIDNTIVSKTFTPDLPATFSGGLVQINTINFPESFSSRIAVSASVKGNTTGKTFTNYAGGRSDYLGYDDGTRSLPSGFPTFNLNDTGITSKQLQDYGRMFKNNWKLLSTIAPVNSNFSLSVGDAMQVFDNEFGYIATFSYRNAFDHTPITRNDYNPDGTPVYERTGLKDTYTVLWGGLLNLTYKLSPDDIISFKNIYNQSADDEVIQLGGIDYTQNVEDRLTSLHYTQRSLYSGQLAGNHILEDLGKLKIDWRLSLASSKREEPDLRRFVYERDASDTTMPFYAVISGSPDPKNGGRFFSNMSELNHEGGLDFTLPVNQVKFKAGGVLDSKTREFSARVLAYKLAGYDPNIQFSAIDSLFDSSHIRPKGLELAEITNPNDRYDASEHVGAAYAMIDASFTIAGQQMRLVGGARLEHSNQVLNSALLGGGTIHYGRIHDDILPAASLIYSVTESMNIRASYSQTIARPEFREIAPFSFYDFEFGTLIQGDTNIDRALIRNTDFRVEYYPTAGELLSLSLFHKRFDGAIEQTNQGSNAIISWANAPHPAYNYGFELEIRKNLGFIGDYLSNFTLSGNYAYIISKVDVKELSLGQQDTRPMQGQAPYTINGGLLFQEPTYGTSLNFLFNKSGKRIAQVDPYSGDLYEMPRNVIDLSISQPIGERYEIKYSAHDLLHEDQVFKSGDKIDRVNVTSPVHSLTFAIRL